MSRPMEPWPWGDWPSDDATPQVISQHRAHVSDMRQAIANVHRLHHKRAWTVGDPVTHGQTEFPYLCNHCRRPYPCETVAQIRKVGPWS